MKLIAVYPGTFDPITNGHTDLAKRATKIFDKLIIAIAENPSKKALFSAQKRVELAKIVFANEKQIEVLSFNKLLVQFAKEHSATTILRGLRAVSDFEYEFQLAGMNRQLNKKIETVFLMSDPDNQVISSEFVKEIAKLNGKIDNFVTKSTIKSIKEKYG